MVKTTVAFCDICLDEGRGRIPAPEDNEFEIPIDGELYVIDPCSDCKYDRVEPFIDMVKRVGTKDTSRDTVAAMKTRPSIQTDGYPCDVDGTLDCDSVLGSWRLRTQHWQRVHPEWWKSAASKPYRRDKSDPLPCKYCDGRFFGRNGLTVHVMNKHPDEYAEEKLGATEDGR